MQVTTNAIRNCDSCIIIAHDTDGILIYKSVIKLIVTMKSAARATPQNRLMYQRSSALIQP